MKCPKCDKAIRCGCKACRKYHGNLPSMMFIKGDIETCPFCKLSLHVDQWLDIEAAQIKLSFESRKQSPEKVGT